MSFIFHEHLVARRCQPLRLLGELVGGPKHTASYGCCLRKHTPRLVQVPPAFVSQAYILMGAGHVRVILADHTDLDIERF